MLISLVI